MSFTDEELAYLRSQPLARFATVAPDGQPDVTPVAFEFDQALLLDRRWGKPVLATRKVRNVHRGHNTVALVIDDLVSFDQFSARGIRVYGTVEKPIERVGWLGPATTCASPPPCHGAGTWNASQSARRGTAPVRPLTPWPDLLRIPGYVASWQGAAHVTRASNPRVIRRQSPAILDSTYEPGAV